MDNVLGAAIVVGPAIGWRGKNGAGVEQHEEDLRRQDGEGTTQTAPQSKQVGMSTNSVPEVGPRRASSRRVRLRVARDTELDYRAALALAKALHARTLFHDLPFSEAKAKALFRRAIDRPELCCLILAEMPWHGQPNSEVEAGATEHGRASFVTETGGLAGDRELLESTGLAGFAYVQVGEHFLAGGGLIATVLAIGVAPQVAATQLGGRVALRLVNALRKWSTARDCKYLLIHVTAGGAVQADRLFRGCGFKLSGGNYYYENR